MKKNHDTEQAGRREQEIRGIFSSIRLIKEVHQKASAQLMKKYGVTGQQAGVLVLAERFPGISLGELARKMYLHISTCSGIVDRLEQKGYIERKRRSSDRRVVGLSLTDRGRSMVDKVPQYGFGMLMMDIESLSDSDIHRISEAMRMLLEVMRI